VIGSTPDESQQSMDSELSFSISSNKQIYSFNEEIFITMTLRNDSNKPIIVNNPLISDRRLPKPLGVVAFTIYSPTGNILLFNVIRDCTRPSSEFILLQPNESTSKRNAVTKDYHFDQVGIYTISAEYSNLIAPPDGTTAWKGTLASNKITIEVVP
jgi:hypothetical protein